MQRKNYNKLTRSRISRRHFSIFFNSSKSGRVSASTLTSLGVSMKSSAVSTPPLGTSHFDGVVMLVMRKGVRPRVKQPNAGL